MGVRLLLDKALAPALASAGLRSPEAILALGGDPQATSVVTVVDLPVDGTVGRFHLKRYRYASWGTSKGLLGRGTLFGTAPEVAEFKNLAFLREKGVAAVRPVAAVSVTASGRLVAHALLTEHVPDAIDLARRLATPGDPVRDDPAVRRRTCELIGRQVHRMHSEAFAHRDLFPRNVLVRVDEDGPAVWFCDCRRGGPPSLRWKYVDDLATLDVDLRDRLPRTDRLRVLRAYAGPEGRLAPFAREVVARRRRHEHERR
ncbi:MAG: hypothetical protein IT460_12875 [Planctomycetes bacterium]|nr:hypothetical protein [Planctomycetota bacterium]